MSTTSIAVSFIKEEFPSLDEYISNYILNTLDENDFTSSNEVFEAIGDFLLSSTSNTSDTKIQSICDTVFNIMRKEGDTTVVTHQKLETPLCIGNIEDCVYKQIEIVPQTTSREALQRQEKVASEIKKRQIRLDQQKSVSAQLLTNPSSSKSDVSPDSTVSQMLNKRDIALDKAGARSGDVRLENFDLSFGNKRLLVESNLCLAAGRRYGLVGRNGLGKTTLLRAISRRQLQLPSHLSILHVEQEVVGNSTTALASVLEADERRHKLAVEIAKINAESNGENADTGAQLTELYAQWEMIDADRAESRAAVILHGLGFSAEMQAKPTSDFSGGWRMRLSLARTLFREPDLLLLDEPTNMLDLKAIVWLEHYLVESWGTRPGQVGSILVVSHDRNFLNYVCTDMLHLTEQRLDAYSGDYDTFVKTRKERLRQQESAYQAQIMERQHIQKFIDTFRYNANRAALVQSKIKLLEKMPALTPVKKETKISFHFHNVDKVAAPVLRLNEVSFHYPSHPSKILLRKVDFSLDSDSRVGLVGENGSGKTTFLKLLMGQLDPVSGERLASGGLRIGYFHQHHVDNLDLSLTPLEILQKHFPNRHQQEYYEALGNFAVAGELAVKPTSSLSGGQKCRLQFALLSFPKPNFLILDEPTNHLDMETIQALSKALEGYTNGVIVVSHDERLLNKFCKEFYMLDASTCNLVRLEDGVAQYRRLVEKEILAEKRM